MQNLGNVYIWTTFIFVGQERKRSDGGSKNFYLHKTHQRTRKVQIKAIQN